MKSNAKFYRMSLFCSKTHNNFGYTLEFLCDHTLHHPIIIALKRKYQSEINRIDWSDNAMHLPHRSAEEREKRWYQNIKNLFLTSMFLIYFQSKLIRMNYSLLMNTTK